MHIMSMRLGFQCHYLQKDLFQVSAVLLQLSLEFFALRLL